MKIITLVSGSDEQGEYELGETLTRDNYHTRRMLANGCAIPGDDEAKALLAVVQKDEQYISPTLKDLGERAQAAAAKKGK